MLIKGFQKTTLLDFPGKVACTVFTGGCNFRCPFCHNSSLVLDPTSGDSIDPSTLLEHLKKRKGILDGVCITGGEPLLQKDIIPFIESIKELGLAVKLDTNGSYSDALEKIISSSLVDYIAMDIKNSFSKYPETIGLESYPPQVEKSIELIMRGGIPYEFRTTVVKELHEIEDIEAIAKKIKGAERYFLQSFKDSGELICQGYSAYNAQEMQKFAEIAKKWVANTSLRGV